MSERKDIDLLVVDNDDDFRTTMARTFSRRGFQVQEAADGEQALAAAQERVFSVAIFGMKMPGLCGLELLRQFKERHAECELLVLTGQGTIENAVQAMKLGAFDFLTKPFPLNELEELILKAYEQHQLRKENSQRRTLLQRTSRSVQ